MMVIEYLAQNPGWTSGSLRPGESCRTMKVKSPTGEVSVVCRDTLVFSDTAFLENFAQSEFIETNYVT